MKINSLLKAGALLVCIFAPCSVFAQRDCLNPVSLTINSVDGVYAKGDTVKVYAKLTDSCTAPLELRIYENAGPSHYSAFKKKPEIIPLELSAEPKLIYCEASNEAKTVMMSVQASDKSTKSRAMVGFAVAPEEFRPGYTEPEDFVSYWDKQKAQLRKSRMKVRMKKVEVENASDASRFDVFDVELSMPEGNPARGYLAMPRNAGKKSLPIVLYVHSAGVSRIYNKSTVANAIRYAKYGNGAIVLDLNAHGMLNGQPQEYYDKLEAGELKGYSNRPLTTLDEFYFRQMYLREVRAMDFLCKLPEWDGKHALVYGESQGGGQAEAIAGLDSRITACVANVPAMTDYGASLLDRQNGWPAAYGDTRYKDVAKGILPYCDGALFLQHTQASLFIVSGWIDETCHAAGIHAAFNASTSPDKVIYPFPYRWHSGTNKPYDKQWNETVGKARDEFINEHLQ